jgi:hypothetical protein
MGMKINEAIKNRTVARIIGVTVDRSMRAATYEKPHMMTTMIAAGIA